MKNIAIFIVSTIVLSTACKSTRPIFRTSLSNSLELERKDEIITLSKNEIYPLIGKTFIVKDQKGKEIPYQWITKGKEVPSALILLTDFDRKETKYISFFKGKPSKVTPRVFGRYVPERMGDFAWENDIIAFRMYGKPLESNPSENAYGMDVWAKNTSNMIINKWYKTADYHHNHGEGLDFFKVGSSLGGGDVLPFIGDSLNYMGNFVSSNILDSGPLRISFQLNYLDYTVGKYHIKTTKVVSLDAGSNMNQMSVNYEFSGIDSLPILAGIVHWDDMGGKRLLDKENQSATYWEPAHGKDGSIATAIYFPPIDRVRLLDTLQHLGGTTFIKNNSPFTFYNGAVWSNAGKINNATEWNSYVANYIEKQQNPIVVILDK